ncbi:maleylpyruvate isomerase family mycothiol-dependent enzyme [Jatrophihabitans sp.]|jgi:uncharacterized protein (TIGR03083 family)|uniref:maleylpyruvate isomerase family mycothiol-dependent enzyme n=1 Tax=Jatrophihabitans sp. TaxID=1932789 RepID=UPI002EF02407
MTTPHTAGGFEPPAEFDPLAEIAEHSAGLARAAENNLEAPVEHCPGWTVADLVWHVTEVHWFWSTVVAGLLPAPVEDDSGPDRPAPEELIARFSAGAEHLVRVLAAADPAAACWTWATQQNAGFVLRHQVQEAAVHHWDAEHAAGRDIELGMAMSVDAIEEFLTFSLSTVDGYHPEVPEPSLDGALVLSASDAGIDWTITDDTLPGTLKFSTGAGEPGLPRISGTASDLLLWLYGRVPLPVTAGSAGQLAAEELVARFRGETFTD